MSDFVCPVCYGEEFHADEEDGRYYCTCGVALPGFISVTDPDDIHGPNAIYNRRNTIRLPTTPAPPPPLDEESQRYTQFRGELYNDDEPQDFGTVTSKSDDCYRETRQRYVDGFLMMIMAQCDALVETFHVTPLIIGIVAPIAMRYIASSGAFASGWADQTVLDSELVAPFEEGEEIPQLKRPNRYGDEPTSLVGKRVVLILSNQLKKMMPLSSTLAISYLACHIAGVPILTAEIVRWVLEGKLPYLSSYVKISEKMGERSAACSVTATQMFKPDQVDSAQMLEVEAALIADTIGLRLSPVNFNGIVEKYLQRLCIDDDNVLSRARVLREWAMPPELYLSTNQHRLPTRVCVMSIIIVALRMLYDINGFGVWEQSLGASDQADVPASDQEPDSPTKKATEELLKKLEARYHELDAETLDHQKDLMSFLLHAKTHLFPGYEKQTADDRYKTVEKLWNGFPENEESEKLGNPSKRPRDDPCSSSPTRSRTKSMDHAQSSSEETTRNRDQEEKSKESLIRRLKEDMGDDLFRYIPPRERVKRQGYLQYVREKEDGEYIYQAHADYYILLRVCAKVAEIDARNMHRAVLIFEKRMAWTEERIAQVLHQPLPSMTCQHCSDDGNVVGEEQGYESTQERNLSTSWYSFSSSDEASENCFGMDVSEGNHQIALCGRDIGRCFDILQSLSKQGSPNSMPCDDITIVEPTSLHSSSPRQETTKTIIFSQWNGMLDLVEMSFEKNRIEFRMFDGTMTLGCERDRAVKEFSNDPDVKDVKVMLISLKAGNLGLNLAAACHVILLDLWWNSSDEDQAIARAHRIGQTRPVTVTRITIKDTIEDRILHIQEGKRVVVASAYGEDHGGRSATRPTVDDLKYLFGA